MPSDAQRMYGSSVYAGVDAEMAASSALTLSTEVAPDMPAYSKQLRALSALRLEIATSTMPGVVLQIWLATPWAMKPAPTMPTRIGRPSASRSASALSTMITASLLRSPACTGPSPRPCRRSW